MKSENNKKVQGTCIYLMPIDRLWNSERKKPERVDDEVKLFNDSAEKFWQKSGVTLRIRSGFDQSLSGSDQNVLEF